MSLGKNVEASRKIPPQFSGREEAYRCTSCRDTDPTKDGIGIAVSNRQLL
jgi:hypothetical protein